MITVEAVGEFVGLVAVVIEARPALARVNVEARFRADSTNQVVKLL